MLEDKLLIWKFKRGNVDALQQIYDKYKGDLLKLGVALTGDVCLAEDVVQDVFVKLAEAHDKISIHGNLPQQRWRTSNPSGNVFSRLSCLTNWIPRVPEIRCI